MAEQTVEIARHGAAAWVWVDRRAVHNAMNEALIEELTAAFVSLGSDAAVRVIVLAGRGKNFCAGADIESMKAQGAAEFEENLTNARRLAALFSAIATSPKPTIARVQGVAIGGGMGLVACCDVAIAATDAVFATSEVRLGLIPATIGPYVVRAIGSRHARRLFLTGERFGAAKAESMGLIHEAVEAEHLDLKIENVIGDLLKGSPSAQSAAKDLIDAIAERPITPELIEDTAMRIATVRAGGEAREGLSAFLERRPASWVPRGDGDHV